MLYNGAKMRGGLKSYQASPGIVVRVFDRDPSNSIDEFSGKNKILGKNLQVYVVSKNRPKPTSSSQLLFSVSFLFSPHRRKHFFHSNKLRTVELSLLMQIFFLLFAFSAVSECCQQNSVSPILNVIHEY